MFHYLPILNHLVKLSYSEFFAQVSTLQDMVTRQQEMQDIGGSTTGGERKLAQDYMNLQQERQKKMKEHMEKLQVFFVEFIAL